MIFVKLRGRYGYQPVHAILAHSLYTDLHGSQWTPLPPPGRDAGAKSARLLTTSEHQEIVAFNTW